MTTIGYHTLEDRDNVDYIEAWGPRPCNRKNAWLGDGYYFWDSDITFAHDWGRKLPKSEYMIFEADILIDHNTFDLYGKVSHKMNFYEIYQLMLSSGHFKQHNNITVSNVIEYIKKNVGFNYNSIRAADYPARAFRLSFCGNKGEFMYLNERVQICLINKNNLSLPTFRVVYPEKYL